MHKDNSPTSGYYDDSSKGKELPNDLIDYYLKERFNIDLHTMAAHKSNLSQSAASQQLTTQDNTGTIHNNTSTMTFEDERED